MIDHGVEIEKLRADNERMKRLLVRADLLCSSILHRESVGLIDQTTQQLHHLCDDIREETG